MNILYTTSSHKTNTTSHLKLCITLKKFYYLFDRQNVYFVILFIKILKSSCMPDIQKTPELKPGYYLPGRDEQGVATLTKMNLKIATDLPLAHSGSEYVSYEEINPQN